MWKHVLDYWPLRTPSPSPTPFPSISSFSSASFLLWVIFILLEVLCILCPNICIWWMHVFHILRNKSVKDFISPSLLDAFYALQSLISSFNRLNCQPLHAFVKELSISTLIIWLTPQTTCGVAEISQCYIWYISVVVWFAVNKWWSAFNGEKRIKTGLLYLKNK